MNLKSLKTQLLGLCIMAGLSFYGCGKIGSRSFNPESVIGPSCRVAEDQRHSFMPKVPGFPMDVHVDSTFTRREQEDIARSVDEWNELGKRLIGSDFFRMTVSPLPRAMHTGDPRDCSSALGSKDRFAVVRETSEERWKALRFNNSIPGATIRCSEGSEVTSQVVMIYTNVIEPSQFTSVMVHELGHVIGLDHSCKDGSSNDKYRSCSGLHSYHSYRAAVMFPSLELHLSSTGQPEVKDSLKANDILRTECMYKRE